MGTMKMLIPVELPKEELIDSIYDSVDHESISEFIEELDVRYADFEVTGRTIGLLLDSITKEFAALYGDYNSNTHMWKQHVLEIKKMMEKFE